jgi:twitching motility two-component system response regulator PilH
VKVLMLSSKGQETDRFWALKQGADLYMTKPFDARTLLTNVESLLN